MYTALTVEGSFRSSALEPVCTSRLTSSTLTGSMAYASNSEAPTMAPFGKTTRSLSVSTVSANFTSSPSVQKKTLAFFSGTLPAHFSCSHGSTPVLSPQLFQVSFGVLAYTT